MIYNLEVNLQNKATVNQLSDLEAGQELLVNYSNFTSVNEQQIPHLVTMNSKAKSKIISLNLDYLKIEMDTKFELPFRVPERFSIKN
jgi:hypothetical protein